MHTNTHTILPFRCTQKISLYISHIVDYENKRNKNIEKEGIVEQVYQQ